MQWHEPYSRSSSTMKITRMTLTAAWLHICRSITSWLTSYKKHAMDVWLKGFQSLTYLGRIDFQEALLCSACVTIYYCHMRWVWWFHNGDTCVAHTPLYYNVDHDFEFRLNKETSPQSGTCLRASTLHQCTIGLSLISSDLLVFQMVDHKDAHFVSSEITGHYFIEYFF